jgi:hypothetical protein
MKGNAFFAAGLVLIGLLCSGDRAMATETFDCSINNHQWELMVHYGSTGSINDVILFVSNTERYVYFPNESEVFLDNRGQRFWLKFKSKPADLPDIEIDVSNGSGIVIFKDEKYNIQCTWNEE